MLRRPHDHHRDLQAWLRPAIVSRCRNQDRHLMKAVVAPPRPNGCHPPRSSTRHPSIRSQTQSTQKQSPSSPFNRTAAHRSCGLTHPIPLDHVAQLLSTRSDLACCSQIPIAPAAPPTFPQRGFLPWRLSDAGRPHLSLAHQRPASETLHRNGLMQRSKQRGRQRAASHPPAAITPRRARHAAALPL